MFYRCFLFLYALINKDYDIVKLDEIKYDNETVEEALYRNDL